MRPVVPPDRGNHRRTAGTKGKPVQNDRLVAIESLNHSYATIRRISELGKRFVQELEAFFVNYHELDSEQFKILSIVGPGKAGSSPRPLAFRRRTAAIHGSRGVIWRMRDHDQASRHLRGKGADFSPVISGCASPSGEASDTAIARRCHVGAGGQRFDAHRSGAASNFCGTVEIDRALCRVPR